MHESEAGGRRNIKGPTPETVERARQLTAMHDRGMSYAEIGVALGISKQRVHQILHRGSDGTTYLARLGAPSVLALALVGDRATEGSSDL
jgi:hypothetical protein